MNVLEKHITVHKIDTQIFYLEGLEKMSGIRNI